jgi:4-amino-4-deoxy-L-arabinose transferase-like glycosyltransferase
MTERGYRLAIGGVALATAALLLLHLGTYPLFDPGEARDAAAAAGGLDAGRPLDPGMDGLPRREGLPLSCVLIEASFAVLGRDELAARLPSALEGAALVAILGLLVAGAAGSRTGLFTALVLASCAGFQLMARAARPEMALVLGIAVAETSIALWFVAPPGERPRWARWAAGLAMGFGFLADGPVALLLPALMLVAGMLVVPRERRPAWGEAGRVLGTAAALCLAVAAPWSLWLASRHGAESWSAVLGRLAPFAAPGRARTALGPALFVPVLLGGFLPWTLFLPGALRNLRRRDPSARERLRVLMALAAGTSFLFWTLSRGRLPTDGLVFLPPLAVLTGIDLREGSGRTNPAVTLRSKLPCIALAGLGLLLAASPSLLGLYTGRSGSIELPDGSVVPNDTPSDALRNEAVGMSAYIGGLLLLLGGAAGVATRSQTLRVVAVAASWILLVPGGLHWWRDFDARERRVRDFAAIVRARGAPGDPVAAYRRRLPSLPFYTGGTVARPRTREELERVVEAPGRAWLVIQRKDLPALAGGAKGAAAGEAVARRFEEVASEGTGGIHALVLLRER